jgi:hypothetical protein
VFSSAIDEAVEEALHPPQAQKPRGAPKKQVATKEAPQKRARTKKDASSGKRIGDTSVQTGAGVPPGQEHRRSQKQRPTPPPAVNEPLTFINFVAAYPLGSEVEGEVASYTSHGAMIEVGLPDGGALHCYVPLTGLGNPPPRKAREVLVRGQRRSFVLVGLDPSRRVAELALPGMGAAQPDRVGA